MFSTKLFSTKSMECMRLQIVLNDVVMFIIGLIITFKLAEMLGEYMAANIEEMKNKKDAYLKGLKEKRNCFKGLNKVPSQTIIQCDKCYNEYGKTGIKTRNIIGRIVQQYCVNCANK